VIEVVVSSLPPALLRAAKFAGMKGNMEHARDLIMTCYTEEGFLAPVAALFLGFFYVDVKPGIGVPPTEDDMRTVHDILKWSDEQFPGACFFLMVKNGLHTQNRDLEGSEACLDQLEPLVSTYPAFSLLVHWTRGRNAILARRWTAAGEHWEAAIEVHAKVNRRSWVPCMALMAGLCHAAGGDATRRDALWAVVMKYKAMNKKNWRAEDLQAFEQTAALVASPPANADLELFFIMKRMAQMRGTPPDHARAIIGNWKMRLPDFAPDDAARCWLLQAELHRLDKNVDLVLRCTDEALALAGGLTPRMARVGVLPEVHLTRAVSLASAGRLEEAARALDRLDGGLLKPLSKEDRMDFEFRKSAVKRWINDTSEETGGGGAAEGEAGEDEAAFESAGEEEEEDEGGEAEELGTLDAFLS